MIRVKIEPVIDTLVLSEIALGADWNRPEEDEAWESLQLQKPLE